MPAEEENGNGSVTQHDRERAEDAKALGNDCYKNGNLYRAIKFFEYAVKIGHEDELPTYLSNLSAAYYESGNYERALEEIDRAFETLHPDLQPALDIRLRLRECRCLLQLKEFDQLLDAIQEIEQKIYDNHMEFGLIEDAALHSLDQANQWSLEQATEFVPTLPFKNPSMGDTIHSYLDAESAISLLTMRTASKKEQAGLSPQCKISIGTLPAHQTNLSFFCSGIDDPRHVFATLIDVLHQKPKETSFGIKMALVNEDPAIIARNVILSFMLDDLSRKNLQKHNDVEVRELLALLHCTYAGLIMPSWLHEKLLGYVRIVSNKLCSGLGLPSWLGISLASIDKIIPIYKEWLKFKTTPETVKYIMYTQQLYCHLPNDPLTVVEKQTLAAEHLASVKTRPIHVNLTSRRKPESKKKGAKKPTEPPVSAAQLGKIKELHQFPFSLMEEFAHFYSVVNSTLDPMLDREPKLLNILKNADVQGCEAHPDTCALLSAHMETHWLPNVTLFSETTFTRPPIATFGYRDSCAELLTMLDVKPLSDLHVPYDYTAAFFLETARSLKKYGSRYYLEWFVNDPHSTLESFSTDDLAFAFFTRFYFSGMVNNFLSHIIHSAEIITAPSLPSHSLINIRIPFCRNKTEIEQYIQSSTCLPTLSDLQRYLGVAIHKDQALQNVDSINLQIAAPANTMSVRQLSTKPITTLKRHEFEDWLNSILVAQTLNMHAYFRCLNYVSSIQFPGHWIGGHVDDIIQNRKRVPMVPYSMEFETLTTIWFPLLKFGVQAVEFADASKVHEYTVTLPPLLEIISSMILERRSMYLLFTVPATLVKFDLKVSMKENIRVVSVFTWSSDSNVVRFWASQSAFEILGIQGFHVRVMYGNTAVSESVAVSQCQPSRRLSDHEV